MRETRFGRMVLAAGKLARTLATPPVMLVIGIVAVIIAGLTGVPLIAGTQQSDSEFIRQLSAWGVLDRAGGVKLRSIAKVADYVIVSPVTDVGDPSGTQFTTRGAAGAVNFTLPAPVPSLTGVFYDFLGVADQNLTVTAGAGKGVSINNAACASLACSTAAQKIGAHIRATCDGTSWHLVGDRVGVTYTVA